MSDNIGHNLPPSMVETVGEVTRDLSGWLSQHPVIATEEEARAGKLLIDRAKLGIQDLEAERDDLVRPLNTQVKEINGRYKGPRELLRGVLDELLHRTTSFMAQEEAKRIKAAEEARKAAEAAEQAARSAERAEKEQLSGASAGELDVDVGAAIAFADQAFADYKTAHHKAQVAERDAEHVRLGGGFTRSLSLRSTEIPIVTDLLAAVEAMKHSERIIEAVVKAARSYKKVHGKYPPGIEAQIERKV